MMRFKVGRLAVLAIGIVGLGLAWAAWGFLGSNAPVSATPTPSLLRELKLDPTQFDKGKVSIQVEKSKYLLTLLYDGRPIRTYPAVFGADPVADKRMEGDKRTPEGHFTVRDRYPNGRWSYFIWIDYPTEASWQKHRAAKARGEIPADATIGGEIGIHGTPWDGLIDMRINWTLGCIAVKNQASAELYQLSQIGTPVVILP